MEKPEPEPSTGEESETLLMYNESKCKDYLTSTFCLFTSQDSSISSSSNPSTPNSIKSTYQPPLKKHKKLDDVDIAIIDSLKGIEALTIKDDEHELFGHQIAATLRRLSHKQKAICKLQMQQILVNIEFPDEHTQQHYHYEQSFNNY